MTGLLDNDGKGMWTVLRIVGWGGAALLLLAPLVAMQFTDEVDWSAGDFVFAAVMLGGAGAVMEIVLRISEASAYRFAAAAAIGGAVLLVWAIGAVGIIGSENNPANQMYAAVLLVLVLGSAIARARPGGMAIVLAVAAAAQAGIGVIALARGLGTDGHNWPLDVVNITGLFTVIWLVSAWLFRKAAQKGAPARA